jgi:hypothetical protein
MIERNSCGKGVPKRAGPSLLIKGRKLKENVRQVQARKHHRG